MDFPGVGQDGMLAFLRFGKWPVWQGPRETRGVPEIITMTGVCGDQWHPGAKRRICRFLTRRVRLL